MSIEELATMLGEQLRAAEEAAYDVGFDAVWQYIRLGMWGELHPMPDNPYRKVSA